MVSVVASPAISDLGQSTESTVSLPTPPGPRYHSDFTACSSGLNTDVTLVARDGIHFRINAAALRLASGVFETTLSLPQSVETEWKEPVIDSLDEDSEVFEDLLRMISGQEVHPDRLTSLDALQPRLLAAEKWDMRAALSIMRVILRMNPDVSSDPLRVFWLGSHFGWKDVTSAASKYSCHDDLLRADKQSLMGQLDVTDVLRLMKFHQVRKDQMKDHLDGALASHLHTPYCSQRRSAEYQDFVWRVLHEMDHTSPARKISDDKLRSMCEETRLGLYNCRTCNGAPRPNSDIFMHVHRFWDTLQQTMTV